MSTIANFSIPHLDAQQGAGVITAEQVAALGAPISSASDAVSRTAEALRRTVGWSFDDKTTMDAAVLAVSRSVGPILGVQAQERTDSTDFNTTGLTFELGPSSDIERGMDEEFLFVPSRSTGALLPVRNMLPRGFRKLRYGVRSHTGQAKWTHPSDTRNLENVGVQREKKEQGAEYFGVGYGWTIPQQWEASALGQPLESELAMAAEYEMDAFAEYQSTWGDGPLKIPGFVAMGDAIITLLSTPFSELTSAQSMLDRIGFMDHLYRKANNSVSPTSVLMPLADMYALNSTRFGSNGEGDSVMLVARSLYPWIAMARTTDRIDNANAGGDGPRWVMWRTNPEDLYIESTASEVFGPFQDRMTFEFVILRRFGGIVNRRPERVMYADFDAYA